MRSGEAGCDLAENGLCTLEWESESFGCVGETNALGGAMPGVPVQPDAWGEVLSISSGPDLDLDNGVVRQIPLVVEACAELDGAATPMPEIEVRLALVHGEPVASDLLGAGNLPHRASSLGDAGALHVVPPARAPVGFLGVEAIRLLGGRDSRGRAPDRRTLRSPVHPLPAGEHRIAYAPEAPLGRCPARSTRVGPR
jgi:hypothetical protein